MSSTKLIQLSSSTTTALPSEFHEHKVTIQPQICDTIPTPLLSKLVEKYKPYLHIHPDELYFPCSIEWYVRRCHLFYGNLLICEDPDILVQSIGRQEKMDSLKTIAIHKYYSTQQKEKQLDDGPQLTGPSEQKRWNLRIASPVASNEESYETRTHGDPNWRTEAEIYCRVRQYRSYFELVYMFTYAYNGPFTILGCFKADAHEADLEHITVRVERIHAAPDDNDIGGKIMSVWYGSHGYRDGYWAEKPVDYTVEDFTHPIVYSALHSHGTYSKPKTWWRILGFANDYTKNNETVWKPKAVHVQVHDKNATQVSDNNLNTAWIAYDGNLCPDGINSPMRQGWWDTEWPSSTGAFRRCVTFWCECCCVWLWYFKPQSFYTEEMEGV